MKNSKELAIEIARETGTFLRSKLNSAHTIDYKGKINLVTEADRISEEMITSKINRLFRDHDILAEEFTYTNRGSDFRWIIDPLDGTTNYAHGYPVFCISIALQKLDEIILGVIYNPMLKEMFVAEKGEGEDSQNNLNYLNEMIMKARAIRRAGSAALDLAYVAAGRLMDSGSSN